MLRYRQSIVAHPSPEPISSTTTAGPPLFRPEAWYASTLFVVTIKR